MKPPIRRLDATAVARHQLLATATEVRKQQRRQALSRLQTQPARRRRQVARRLGGSRHRVGRGLAAYAAGGVARLLTMTKAPGTPALVPPAVRQALTQPLAQPAGLASDQALWPWRQHDEGLARASNTGPRRVRSPGRGQLQVPRPSPLHHPCRRFSLAGALYRPAPGYTHRGPGGATSLCRAPWAPLWPRGKARGPAPRATATPDGQRQETRRTRALPG